MVRTHELKEGNQIPLTFIIQVLLETDTAIGFMRLVHFPKRHLPISRLLLTKTKFDKFKKYSK